METIAEEREDVGNVSNNNSSIEDADIEMKSIDHQCSGNEGDNKENSNGEENNGSAEQDEIVSKRSKLMSMVPINGTSSVKLVDNNKINASLLPRSRPKRKAASKTIL